MATNKNVVVIGGGISGLSAAYDLTRAGVPCTLIEQQPRLGGVIDTRTASGCTLEGGPDSFLTAKPDALKLIKELGLENEVIGSNDHQRTTYIMKHDRLVALPEGVMMIVPTRVMPMVKSPLLGWPTKMRMGLEYFRKPGSPKDGQDRSVADFVTEHFGQETLDYLAEPLLSGVYGGDPAQLSVASVLPRFVQMEKQSGSLVRAVLESRRKNSTSPGPLFTTLKSGLGKIVDSLSKTLKVCHATARTIQKTESGFRILVTEKDGEHWLEANDVIVACPAWSAARLLVGVNGELAELLGQIDYSSSLTLSLIYRKSDFDGRQAGFGFLVPQKERRRLAACTFVGTKFNNRVPDDRIVLRCFFGGISDGAVLDERDESIVNMAREELRRILGLTATPIDQVIARWSRSMAQFTVGHQKRVQTILGLTASIPGLHLAGNGYEGIGIPDCIRTGRAAAKNIIEGA